MTKKKATITAVTATPIAPEQPAPKPAKDYMREVTLDGTTYKLDFSMRNLCAAEAQFNREGRGVNLLFALSVVTLNLQRLRDLFAAAIQTHHPDLGYEGAVALVTTDHLMDIANAAFSVLQDKAA